MCCVLSFQSAGADLLKLANYGGMHLYRETGAVWDHTVHSLKVNGAMKGPAAGTEWELLNTFGMWPRPVLLAFSLH